MTQTLKDLVKLVSTNRLESVEADVDLGGVILRVKAWRLLDGTVKVAVESEISKYTIEGWQ